MSFLPSRVLPVLMYHRFGSVEGGDPELWVTMEQFAAQLRWLRAHRFRTLSLDEAYASLSAGQIPKRTVLLTIDDGFAGDLERAADLLEQEKSLAAVFVPAGLLGQTVDLSYPAAGKSGASPGTIIDSRGLQRWLDRGFDVGCHSLSHLDLTTCDSETLSHEISHSREQLAAVVGRPIRDFCYPFAHHNEVCRRAVAAAGYRAAYAGEPPTADIFAIPRMMVYPGDDEARFRRKVSGFYFWISALHQKLRRFVGN